MPPAVHSAHAQQHQRCQARGCAVVRQVNDSAVGHALTGTAWLPPNNEATNRGMALDEPPQRKPLEPCNAQPPPQRQLCPPCAASAASGDSSPTHCKPHTRHADHAACAKELLYVSCLILGVGRCWDLWCRQASRGRRAQRQGLMQLHGLKRRDLLGCRRAGPRMSISWLRAQSELHASQELREIRTDSSSFYPGRAFLRATSPVPRARAHAAAAGN